MPVVQRRACDGWWGHALSAPTLPLGRTRRNWPRTVVPRGANARVRDLPRRTVVVAPARRALDACMHAYTHSHTHTNTHTHTHTHTPVQEDRLELALPDARARVPHHRHVRLAAHVVDVPQQRDLHPVTLTSPSKPGLLCNTTTRLCIQNRSPTPTPTRTHTHTNACTPPHTHTVA